MAAKKKPKKLPFPAQRNQEKDRLAKFTVTVPCYGKPEVVDKMEETLRLALTTQFGSNVKVTKA